MKKKSWFNKSWFGWLNFIILQWLGVRLAAEVKKKNIIGWTLIGPILPLSGWWGRYIGWPNHNFFSIYLKNYKKVKT